MPQPTTLETDYLVIGAGAAGLAFADTLLDHSSAHITLVDRRGQPGGHWNDAYPFVRLHQPSAFYGVNSTELGTGRLQVLERDLQGRMVRARLDHGREVSLGFGAAAKIEIEV